MLIFEAEFLVEYFLAVLSSVLCNYLIVADEER